MSQPDPPLRHVRRVNPPWDPTVRTECGRNENDVKVMVERDEAIAFVKKYTMARAVFVHCTVCLDRLRYGAPTWEKGAIDVVTAWLSHRHSHGEAERLEQHLHALAALVEHHRAEYDSLLNVPSLAAHRRAKGARR